MSYLKRKIDDALVAWKKRPHMPLIVTGARQVGKTAAIVRFGKAHYRSLVYINFALDGEYKGITAKGYTAAAVVKAISLLNGDFDFRPNETLIVFDEIQDFLEIATSLKSFREDGRFDVIASGSLLGVQYHRIASFAVGNQETYELCSMDFEEFLWANGRGESFVDEIYGPMAAGMPYSELELGVFNDLFMSYCTVGGMPAVVDRYVSQGHYQGILGMQREIVESYAADARKYCESLDQARIVEVYRSVPS